MIPERKLAGILEIDPCFGWSQFVTAGIGIADDIAKVYKDMHMYLKGDIHASLSSSQP